MPLLYASPFDLLEAHEGLLSQDRIKRHASLLFLLMNCCSKERDGDLGQDDDDQEAVRTPWSNLPPICPSFQAAHESFQNPLVDYLSAYHHHYLCMNLSSTFPVLFPNIQRYSPPSQSNVSSSAVSKPSKHSTQKRQQSKQDQQPKQDPLPPTTMTMFTRNEIERTLLLHSPESIRTLSLPIQRLPAFPSIILHLSSLIRFELYGVSWDFNLDPAIEFLRQHARQHGTIRELKMAGPNDTRALKKPKVHEILQAIEFPRIIDLSRYREAVMDINSYQIQNIDRLEQLLFNIEYVPLPQQPTATSEESETVPIVPTVPEQTLDLIKKCTGLTVLHIGVQDPTAFSWAVNWFDHGPMPLKPKVLHLSSARPSTAKQVVEDCVYGFRDSLEYLRGISIGLSPASASASSRLSSFGWSWPLHRLSVLSLRGELATWFNMESLRFCPRLTEFRLRLHPHPPTRTDFLEKIHLAPELKVFVLTGLWIVSDSTMNMLGSGLPKLQSLVMVGCECTTLTANGLKQGLDRMKALRRAQLDLGVKLKAAIEEYRVDRPGLEIRGVAHDNILAL